MQTLCPYCQVELRFTGTKSSGPLNCPNCHRVWTSIETPTSPPVTSSRAEAVKQVVACPKCTARYKVPTTAGDRMLSCPKCRYRFRIPTPRAIHRPTRTSEGVPVRCRYCVREFLVPQSAVNGWTMCPGCSVVAITVAAQPSVTPARPQAQPVQPPAVELDELPTMPPSSRWSASPSVMPKNDSARFTETNPGEMVHHRFRELPSLWLAIVGVVIVLMLMGMGVVVLSLAQWEASSPSPPELVTNQQEKGPSDRTQKPQPSSPSSPVLVTNRPLSGEELYPRLVRATVLIVHPQGQGSGFIVDTDQRKIITNYHVVRYQKQVAVVFPLYDPTGELITDFRRYEPKIKDVAFRGEVLAVDPQRDLALIQVEKLPGQTAALPLAEQPAKTGAVVYSVGGSGADDNLLWRLTKGTVRGRVQRRQYADFGLLNCMILETDAPVNPGDSGGPVVNDRCELVAVVSHGRVLNQLVSGNIDVEEVRHFLRTHSTRR